MKSHVELKSSRQNYARVDLLFALSAVRPFEILLGKVGKWLIELNLKDKVTTSPAL
jgi:hypothetical protein